MIWFDRGFYFLSLSLTITVVFAVLFGEKVIAATPARPVPADMVLIIVGYMVCATIAAGRAAFRREDGR